MATPAESPKLKVKKDTLTKAIRALQQVVNKRSAGTNKLFAGDSETMTLLFTFGQIPDKKRVKPVMIPLPCPMHNEKSEVCFISKDPQKNYKELLLQKHPVPGLTKVIGIDKLRRNYKAPEDKRKLADAFDLFLCDSRVVEMMPKLLGKVFYFKKHKAPIPIRLIMEDPKPALERAIKGTPLRVPTGPCVGVRFGRASMPEDDLVQNAAAVIRGVVDNIKGNPVMNIAVQATDAPALPVWRRPAAPGGTVNLKKYHSDASSSAASETGASGASETEGTSEIEYGDLPSDAGETLSTRESASDVETGGGDVSLESQSELDSEAGDGEQDIALSKQDMPLVKGLRNKKTKRKAVAAAAAAADSSTAAATKAAPPAAKREGPPAASDMMPPPKKVKKAKAKAGK